MNMSVITRLNMESPFQHPEIAEILDSTNVANVPLNRIIRTLLMGINNGDIQMRWMTLLDDLVLNQDESTSLYLHYIKINPYDFYDSIYDAFLNYISHYPIFINLHIPCHCIEITHLDDELMVLDYGYYSKPNYTP